MKYKNKLHITGTRVLLDAFMIELINLGYKQDYFYERSKIVTVNTNNNGEFSSFLVSITNANYHLHLPEEWNLAIEKSKEIEEEIPEYVRCISTTSGSTAWTKGKIYKTEQIQIDFPKCLSIICDEKQLCSVELWNSNSSVLNTFKPSTKEEFDKQESLPKEITVAGYKVEVVKVPGFGYSDPKFINKIVKIGCEYYTKESLITIKAIAKQIGNEFTYFHYSHGEIRFSIKEVGEVIKLLET